MSTQTVADYLLAAAARVGRGHVFAFPGDGINGMLAAWGRADNEPQFIQARHEEMSAFEAVGYAKFTGRLGVCMATSGPGAIHLLNGLYDAKLDHVPVVAIVGQTTRSRHGRLLPAGGRPADPVQGRRQRLRADGHRARAAAQRARPGHPHRAGRAAPDRDHHPVRRAGARVLPADPRVQDGALQPRHRLAGHRSPTTTRRPVPPSCSTPAARSRSWSGPGPAEPAAEVEQVADLLGAGVAKALLGKDVLSDDLPYVTGSIGLLGTRPSYEMMRDCDTLLTVGSSFPYTQFMPESRPGPRGADRHRPEA